MRKGFVVRGRVQGVGFRYATLREARRLGVRGWVRNLASGEVEVVAEGEAGVVEEFAGWLGVGPEGARVDEVVVRGGEVRAADEEFAGFEIR